MNPERWARLAEEFEQLCDRPPAEREDRLAALAAEDAELAAELARMLAADASTGGALAGNALALAGAVHEWGAPSEALQPGLRLGAWRLVERLGAGGMGEVWSAERADGAFEQTVALKLLKRGLETEALLARFALERRILARLIHPGIARLLDAGAAPDGRPFFVLERVDGKPITRWAQERALSVPERLKLVLQICEAVEFAHRNLIVHRDLKPSNVLVSADGQVKLLDFGVAKLLEGDEAGAEMTATELGGRALTPEYAAPEQLRGEPVTTATDVYALGVLLYELLTGRLPHRRRRALTELVEGLETESAERPSTVVRRDAERGEPEPARRRLAHELGGDLDTIALKALAREPDRRYATAAALAADIDRHLTGRPILARPDDIGYRFGKFVRRHRLAVGAALAIAIALLAGLAAAIWQADRATREARRAGRVRDFLVSVFESRDPDRGTPRQQTVEQLVDASVGRLASELGGEPEVEADLAEALARAELSLGRFDNAERLANRALELRRFGERSIEVAECWTTLGAISRARGASDAVERLLRALEIASEAAGPDGIEASRARIELAALATAEGRFTDAVALAARAHEALLAKLGPDHRSTLGALFARSEAAIHGGDRREAERVLRAALSDSTGAPPSLPLTRALLRRELAHLLILMRRSPEALQESEQALLELERLLGEDHPEVGQALHVRAMALEQSADFHGALEVAERGLAVLTRVDPDHPRRAALMREIGSVYFHLGQIPKALECFNEALAIETRAYGPDSERVLEERSSIAHALHHSGRDAEAFEQTSLIVSRLRADPLLGATLLPSAVTALHSKLLRGAGRYGEAIEVSRFGVDCLRRRGAIVDPGLEVEASLDLAVNLIAAGGAEERREARRIAEAALVPVPGSSLGAHVELPDRLLGQIEFAEENFPEARRRFEKALAANVAAGKGSSLEAAETRLELGLTLEKLGELEAAKSELDQAASLLFRRRGRDAPETVRASSTALARVASRLN